ncbi:MAG: sugar diacid recognition domain-containing protein [Spirochaetia bacterium]
MSDTAMEAPLLNPSMASDLIRRLNEHIGYNIDIMDREGIIIASRDTDRIGTFYEPAYSLVGAGAPVASVSPDGAHPDGVRPGVYLPIVYRGETIGVVGIAGNPREVEPVAFAVKTSVETMVEHELYKEHTVRHQDKKNLFLNYLLYDDETPRPVVEGLAAKLGYEPPLLRAPILLRLPAGTDADEALGSVRRNGIHTSQDISCVTPDGAILVFKVVRLSGEQIISRFEEQTSRFASSASAIVRSCCGSEPCRVCIGSYQKEFKYYRAAYRQLLWLAERFSDRPPDPAPVFFYHHVLEYIASRVPRSELCQIFGATVDLLPQDFLFNVRASVEALFESAYNGKEAAARLGIHRNTLTARLERLRELFGIDLRSNAHARDFLSMLARYLQLPGASVERK